MRKFLLTSLVAALGLAMVLPGASVQASNEWFTFTQVEVLEALNPCDGSPMEVTLNEVHRVRDFESNGVSHHQHFWSVDATTDQGHVSSSGNVRVLSNIREESVDAVGVLVLRDQFRNPETGQEFIAKNTSHVVWVDGEVVAWQPDVLELRCVALGH